MRHGASALTGEISQPEIGLPSRVTLLDRRPSIGVTYRFWARFKAYVALTKPRIIELLLITTVPTMFVAAHGAPRLSLIVLTMFGGTLAAGGAMR